MQVGRAAGMKFIEADVDSASSAAIDQVSNLPAQALTWIPAGLFLCK